MTFDQMLACFGIALAIVFFALYKLQRKNPAKGDKVASQADGTWKRFRNWVKSLRSK